MSASAEDEARARLEVAQLYEEMGQTDKAVRYLHGAAEILRSGGLVARARELYQKILKLEPSNQAAKAALGAMGGALPGEPPPAAGGAAVARPAPPPPARPAAQVAAAQVAAHRPPGNGAGVMTPTPLLYRDNNLIMAAREQLTGPPDYKLFPYDPLPRVDSAVVAARVEARRKAEDSARKKANPRVESSFGGQGGGGFARPSAPAAAPAAAASGAAPAAAASSSGTPAGGLFGQTSGGRRPSAPAAAAGHQHQGRPAGEIRGGNRDLADLIAKRLKEGK